MIRYNENMLAHKEDITNLNSLARYINKKVGKILTIRSTKGHEADSVDICVFGELQDRMNFKEALLYLQGVFDGVLFKENFSNE